ncbi:DUF1660 family phage protein [Niallia alba]
MKLRCFLLGHYWVWSMTRHSNYKCNRCGKRKLR